MTNHLHVRVGYEIDEGGQIRIQAIPSVPSRYANNGACLCLDDHLQYYLTPKSNQPAIGDGALFLQDFGGHIQQLEQIGMK